MRTVSRAAPTASFGLAMLPALLGGCGGAAAPEVTVVDGPGTSSIKGEV